MKLIKYLLSCLVTTFNLGLHFIFKFLNLCFSHCFILITRPKEIGSGFESFRNYVLIWHSSDLTCFLPILIFNCIIKQIKFLLSTLITSFNLTFEFKSCFLDIHLRHSFIIRTKKICDTLTNSLPELLNRSFIRKFCYSTSTFPFLFTNSIIKGLKFAFSSFITHFDLTLHGLTEFIDLLIFQRFLIIVWHKEFR